MMRKGVSVDVNNLGGGEKMLHADTFATHQCLDAAPQIIMFV